MRFHFISGLPRSGSTLLAALLLQNPRFHAGMTSPVGALFHAVMAQFSAGSEFAPVVDAETRRRLLRAQFDAWYAAQIAGGKQAVFDTNRMWCAKLPALLDLFPDCKIIACVRNVAWVMDSIERIYRSNPFDYTRLFGSNMARSHVYSRLEGLAHHDQMVGFAWASLREAFYGEHAKSMLVVDYEWLTRAPARVMQLIYEFLGEPLFEHDFEHVDYDASEFDLQLGTPGLHRVKRKVEYRPRNTVIPPDLFAKFSQMSFWSDPSGSCANVIATPQ